MPENTDRQPSMHRPVVVLTVPFGSAHQRTADALSQAWEASPRPTELIVIPLEAYMPRMAVRFLLNAYLGVISRVPRVFSYVYARGREPGVSNRALRAAIRFARSAGRRLHEVVGGPPGVWVSTHPLTSVVACASEAPDALLSVLITDHHFHAFWCTPGADHYFVGRPEIRKALIARGVPRRAVELTGIPIDPCFGVTTPRDVAEHRLGLAHAGFRVLVMGGGLGIGPIEDIATHLSSLGPQIQTVVVAGRNHRLKRRLTAHVDGCVVFGYTENIRDLLAASDVCITKPGGLTIAETSAAGLPTLLVDPLPGHEEANTETLVREGSAFRVPDVDQVAEVILELRQRPRLLRRMGQRMARHGRPRAACDAADSLADLWRSKFHDESSSR